MSPLIDIAMPWFIITTLDMADSKSENEKIHGKMGMYSYVTLSEDDQKTNGACQKTQGLLLGICGTI